MKVTDIYSMKKVVKYPPKNTFWAHGTLYKQR